MELKLPPPCLLRVDQLCNELSIIDGTEFAYDFETNGLRYMDEGFFVRCVSFHNDSISMSVELSDKDGNYYPGASALFSWLTKQEGLIAHNSQFESGVLFAMTGVRVPHLYCTYTMLGRLANEGEVGHGWGLKPCAMDLLGIPNWTEGIPKSASMCYLDFELLGRYNQIDSMATWGIYQVCQTAINKATPGWGEVVVEYFREDMRSLLELQAQCYTNGILLDVAYAEKFFHTTLEDIEASKIAFTSNPTVASKLATINSEAIRAAEDIVKNYPKKLKKDGKISKGFKAKLEALEIARCADHFNIDSSSQLSHLLYNMLGVEVKRTTLKGAPSTSKKALSEIPTYGKLLLNYREAIARHKFLRSCLSNHTNGLIRVGIKVPGTITGRCSSGDID